MNGWDWLGNDRKGAITANVSDGAWAKNPAAVYVCGSYGEAHMDQFSGCGPSTKPYKFKALQIDGVVYIPNPHTREIDAPESRQWLPAPVQPPTYAIQSL